MGNYVPLDEAAVSCGLSREDLALRVLEDDVGHQVVHGRVVVDRSIVDRYRPWWRQVIEDQHAWLRVAKTQVWPALVRSACDELGVAEEDIFNGRRDNVSVERRDRLFDAARRFGFTYHKIAALCGMDRQTVWHAMRRIEHYRITHAEDRTVTAIMMGARNILAKEWRMA